MKIQIIDEAEKFPAKKKSVIAEEFQVHPSTVTVVLKNKEKYRADFQSGTVDTSTQRQRQSKYTEVDINFWTGSLMQGACSLSVFCLLSAT